MIIQHQLIRACVLQKDAASQTTHHHLALNFHWRASAFLHSAHEHIRWTLLSTMNGESERARAGVRGLRGEPARIKARTNKGGRGHATSPRKGKVAASPCKHKLWSE